MDLSREQLDEAKKRIWTNMQSKLPGRAESQYSNVLASIEKSAEVSTSRLLKVQLKERLMSSLPEREMTPAFSERFLNLFAQKKMWSMSILSIFMMFLFAPIFKFAPSVSAGANSLLEVEEGSVFVKRGSETLTVVKDMILVEGDKLEVAPDSMAHIYFVDDSRMTLGPSTSIVITEIYSTPGNKARTEVVVDQLSGEAWTQVLNLVNKDSFFAHRFPGGEISVRQKASFNVDLQEKEIEVSKNLLDVMVINEDFVYEGTLGQGVKMTIADKVETSELSEEEKNDAWWKYNVAFGKDYSRKVEEQYKQESVDRVLILPGNPFYKLKTFQESVRSFMTFSDEGKQKLAVEFAENRLREAQSLIALGENEKATETLEDYEEAVNEVVEMSGGSSEELIAHAEEVQKELLTQNSVGEGTQILESHLISVSESSESKLLSASQKLQRVPDLIENEKFEEALIALTAYRDESREILVELESVPLDQRSVVLSSLLDQKLKDLQMLRIIAAMPELSDLIDVDAQILEEMNMIVLSLREREITHLSDFFANGSYDKDVQLEIYSKLKDSLSLDPILEGQLNTIEKELSNSDSGSGIVIDIKETPVELNTHTDEAEHETDSGEESSDDPESHYNL